MALGGIAPLSWTGRGPTSLCPGARRRAGSGHAAQGPSTGRGKTRVQQGREGAAAGGSQRAPRQRARARARGRRVDEQTIEDCSSAQAESILINLHLLPYKIPNCQSIKYQFSDPDSRHHGQNSARLAQPHGGIELHGKGVQYCMYRMRVLVLPMQVGSTVHLY